MDDGCLKDWFHTNARAKSESSSEVYFPSYLGEVAQLSTNEEVCDFWVFPGGSRAYCFHVRDEKFATHCGGNPISRNSGKGVVILVLSDQIKNNEKTIVKTILSFKAFFKKYPKYAYNVEIQGEDNFFESFDSNSLYYKERIEKFMNAKHEIRFSININSTARFNCKLALAIGHNMLGDSFLNSDYAQELRNGLWNQFNNNKVRGNSSTSECSLGDLRIGNANTILLQSMGGNLFCSISIYGNQSLILISPDADTYQTAYNLDEGLFWAWLPYKSLKSTPISLPVLIAHKQGFKVNDELLQIEKAQNIHLPSSDSIENRP